MKKELVGLGTVGLALAVVATPIFSASTGALSVGGDTTVNVVVAGVNPDIDIIKPLDGSTFYEPIVPVSVIYSNATQVRYKLTHVASDGTRTDYALPTHIVAPAGTGLADGSKDFDINMPSATDGYFGKYILSATADGTANTEDLSSFEYRALQLDNTGKIEEETNNPSVEVKFNAGVDHIAIQVFDEDGNAMFRTPIELTGTVGPDSREVLLDLFLAGAPTGIYKVVATPYDAAGNIIDRNATVEVEYEAPEVPEVPDTGFFLGNLDISEPSMIAAASAIFFLVVLAFFMVIKKSSGNQKKAYAKRRK